MNVWGTGAHPFAPLALAGYAEITPLPDEHDDAAFRGHRIALPPAIAGAVPRRRREFLHGRRCARAAIAAATGREGVDVAVGADRRPLFPAPLSGSITHSDDFAAAACVHDGAGSLGIDAEPFMDDALAQRIAPLVARARELDAAQGVGAGLVRPLTAIYSAKESLYKALSPFFSRVGEFSESEWIGFYAATGRFELELSPSLEGGWGGVRVQGQLVLRSGGVLTAILIPPTLSIRP